MSHKVNAILFHVGSGDDPRRVRAQLVDPLAVLHRLAALFVRHHDLALVLDRVLVIANTAHELHLLGVSERVLGLLKHLEMADVRHVENAVLRWGLVGWIREALIVNGML